MQSRPSTTEEVFKVMSDYCSTKQINLSDYWIRHMAEDCFLLYQSKDWNGAKYWPALAMRWVLNNSYKYKDRQQTPKKKPDTNKESIRDRLLKDKDNV